MFLPSYTITHERPTLPKAIPTIRVYGKKPGSCIPVFITDTGEIIDYGYHVITCRQGYQWLLINGLKLKYRITRNFSRNVEAFKKLHYSTTPLSIPETTKITNPFCFYIKGEKWTYDPAKKDWWVEVVHTTLASNDPQRIFIRITDIYGINIRYYLLCILYPLIEPDEDDGLLGVMGDFLFDHFKPPMPVKPGTNALTIIYPPLLTPVYIREEDGEYKLLQVSDTVIVDDASDREFVFKDWVTGHRLVYQYQDSE